MAPIVSTIDVGRPPEDVFAYATDPSRFHEWQKGVVSGRMEGGGAPAVTQPRQARSAAADAHAAVDHLERVDSNLGTALRVSRVEMSGP